jgi:hypothetical protein
MARITYLNELFKQLICETKGHVPNIPGMPVCIFGGTRHEDPVMNGLLEEMDQMSVKVFDSFRCKTDITHEFASGGGFIRVHTSTDWSNGQLDMTMSDGSRFVFNK